MLEAERLQRDVAAANQALLAASSTVPLSARAANYGRVTQVSDTVLQISGLEQVGAEDVVTVGQSARALVTELRADGVRAVLLDYPDRFMGGMKVAPGSGSAEIAVGEEWLGRITDPLGRPLDGQPCPDFAETWPLERDAVPLHLRDNVRTPLYTGSLAIDSMFPIGRGQRELILGAEGTGKTSLALDAMLRQKNTDVVCVYAAIGRRRSDTWQVFETLQQKGGRFVIVAAPEDTSPALRYLAPYAATTIAEFFRDRGEHALIVYDDLSAQAGAWRELALLLRRPPGREAYPGDVFYLHSRLLERSTQLASEAGGGSLTALPICRLEAGGISAYIPTNLVSITDGQIVLSEELFAAGQKPAVAAGLSVSRIGGNAQAESMRRLARRLRLEYASFLELEAFAQLGTRLDASSERRLERGRRVRMLLRSQRLQPLDVFAEIVRLLIASDTELLLSVALDNVSSFAEKADRCCRNELPQLSELLNRGASFSTTQQSELLKRIQVFARAER